MDQYMNETVGYARAAESVQPVQGFTERHCDRLVKALGLAREVETMLSSLNERMFGSAPSGPQTGMGSSAAPIGRAEQMDRLLDDLTNVMSRVQDEAARANSRI